MLSAKDVRGVTFSKQVNGYRREEVDVFLDKVESDYENYERILREMNEKVHELETQISESKSSEGSIQSVLLSAQKLADSIVAEAKAKSEAIVEEAKANLENFKARENELSVSFDKKAEERKKAAKEELDKIIDEAKVNRDKISDAVANTVEKQAQLYNRLKLETAAFKAEIMEKYKRHLELISKIPDTIPADPNEVASAVDLKVDDLSDKEGFINGIIEKTSAAEKLAAIDIINEIIEEEKAPEAIPVPEAAPEVPSAPQAKKSGGFVVNTVEETEDNGEI